MSDSDGMTAGKSVVRRDRRIRQITCHKRSVCFRFFRQHAANAVAR